MAILKNCELYFVKCNPKRPNAKFNKANPTWEVQIRTTDKAVKKEWEALSIKVQAIVPDEGAPYFRANLRRKTVKANKELASPPEVMNGKKQPINPDTIGNGSVGHVRIFQYEYEKEGGGTGIASVLMGMQVIKHIIYTPNGRTDDFDEEETETIGEVVEEMTDDGNGDY